jgi:hypothetical protein
MPARRLPAPLIILPAVLLVLLRAGTGWSDPDPGQAERAVPETGLLPVDASAFEIAVATGGFYYFWRPGEFSALDPEQSPHLFAAGETIAQFDGRLQGTSDLSFLVEAGDAAITVRAGLQSRGEIQLFAPGARRPYAGEEDTRTAHMRIVHVPAPMPGRWTVRLAGAGLYLVNVTTRAEPVVDESEADQVPPFEDTMDPRDDLDRFQTASPDERWDLFRRLPPERRHRLARSLLDDDDPAVAYLAASSLAGEGHLDLAVPVFARILVRGEDETALNGRMGYDWIHSDDDGLAERIMDALARHLRAHLDDYTPSERARAERLLGIPTSGERY